MTLSLSGFSRMTSLLSRWLRFRSIDPSWSELNLPETANIVLVLDNNALSDRLALHLLCRKGAIGSVDASLATSGHMPRHVMLHQLKRSFLRSPQNRPSPHFEAFLENIEHHQDDVPVMVVPVAFFWGRRPGREARGLWGLMTADHWPLSGRLRRLTTLLFNGHHIDVRFGTPYDVKALLNAPAPSASHARRRVVRLLRHQFQQLRQQVLGPDLSHRRTLVRSLLMTPSVRQAISAQAEESGAELPHVEKQAQRYAREIASHTSPQTLWLLYQLLGRLWNRLYDGVKVHGLSRVRELAGTHELIYVPCHRSHIDYLLLSYVMYHHGLTTPQVAAGRNLNMPVIGSILRKGGAFFVRRSFKGNALYGAVFNEYLHQLIRRGYPVEYFIEGGRSRTGRTLPPRLGMLAMTLDSFLRKDSSRPMAFVPIYIGYEKVLESGAYQRELTTGHKKKESPFDVLKVFKRLREPYGQVHVNIGAPLRLDDWLNQHFPDPVRTDHHWRKQAVAALGEDLATRINAAATLNGINLVALALLGTSHMAIEEDLLARQLTLLNALQAHAPATQEMRCAEGTPSEWINHAIDLGMIARCDQTLGPVIVVAEGRAPLLTWYRNNVLHLFARPALLAFAFRHRRQLTLGEIDDLVGTMWPALDNEFFLEETDDREESQTLLQAMTALGLLKATDRGWERGATDDNEQLHWLGAMILPTLERGFLLVSLLLRSPSGTYTAQALEQQSQALAERLTLLQGLNAPEYFDKRLFSGLLDTLIEGEWIHMADDDTIVVSQALDDALRQRRRLFDAPLRRRLHHLLAQPEAQESD
ncbi:glycerol-3-phosphate 1-O-acyltransferase PlsB [Larsenimonas rhizosphaerae]|uniref:Glycerol-3-phosphate acyltransferase n=1 Tax=Larsenimonas rhizosphaerae TaxID=2944682 RepID=A0AA41ZJQ5_9GAMM|nr:glycerol-3-phosphate 1-O-acyltransferase PlsB [Larsenimonas rhizosphaerae]MCX2522823.1 glycerol-3-phosphate 1-O-acyltransferase PlsB [Larsenimonas rhizosphaerae]